MAYRMTVSGETMLHLKRELETAAKAIFWSPNGEESIESVHVRLLEPELKPEVTQEQAREVLSKVEVTTPNQVDLSNSQYDSRGIPWDSRVHSASREKVTDGSWRKRRGITDEVRAQVESTLPRQAPVAAPSFPASQGVASGPVVPAASFPPAFGAGASLGNETASSPFVQQAVQPIPVAPAPTYTNIPMPQANETQPAHTLVTFKQNFGPTISELVSKGKITPDYLNRVCEHLGVKQIWEVMTDENKLSQVFENFCQMGFITKVG